MSCSSNRKRLVGSCIRTFVSSTNSLAGSWGRVAGPNWPAGLADLRATRVSGVGRVLRSTMGLLGTWRRLWRKGHGHPSPALSRTQALVAESLARRTGCGAHQTARSFPWGIPRTNMVFAAIRRVGRNHGRPSMHRLSLPFVSAFLFAAFTFSSAVNAAAQRTFVASNGLPANTAFNCSLVKPFRAFSEAIGVTNAGGEVIVLDSAGYGAVTITKSVSIISPPGIHAGISVFSGDGVTINAGASDIVVLRGLSINGQGEAE